MARYENDMRQIESVVKEMETKYQKMLEDWVSLAGRFDGVEDERGGAQEARCRVNRGKRAGAAGAKPAGIVAS